MPSPRKTRSLTVAHGEIDASDKTTSLLLPIMDPGCPSNGSPRR